MILTLGALGFLSLGLVVLLCEVTTLDLLHLVSPVIFSETSALVSIRGVETVVEATLNPMIILWDGKIYIC